MTVLLNGRRFRRTVLMLLLALLSVGILAKARSTWSYSPLPSSETRSLQLIGTFDVSSLGRAQSLVLTIINQSSNLVTVLWDECAMVLPDGSSQRIIHTDVRIIDRAAPQAPTAIAPNSRTTESVWPSQYFSIGKYVHERDISLQDQGIIRLYLTCQIGDGRHTEEWAWVFAEHIIPEPEREPRKPINWGFWLGILGAWTLFVGILYATGIYVPE